MTRVTRFEGDIQDYRRLLSSRSEPEPAKDKPPDRPKGERTSGRAGRAALAPLRAEVRACEERLEKIADMLEAVDRRLADPALYEGPPDRIEALQKKRAEIVDAQARAEALWLAAEEALEAVS